MDIWRKSSYSGERDGDNCVEIAGTPAQVAVRDSKARDRATLTFPAAAFAAFVEGLKESAHPPGAA
ncbi:DUF397 domain-containing protein [Streptomyces sp. SBST2-5]|uniref:DUF397 domain-containing protein n=1 Tax=Streptomyces composti TaxID=2720025 RepID=A0ABX1AG18_9ACTN|nr:DUF397 domain-containing protein [Streptomyces composti]NJP53381.1 DUF397 domain-containing protein [Streptomyces composti]